ncbi:hypothetical protein FRC00_001873 [Tulasnella sp. 408]|nr:hypothetical protein FRC00_001873 [Tulasnella sp. 408]
MVKVEILQQADDGGDEKLENGGDLVLLVEAGKITIKDVLKAKTMLKDPEFTSRNLKAVQEVKNGREVAQSGMVEVENNCEKALQIQEMCREVR